MLWLHFQHFNSTFFKAMFYFILVSRATEVKAKLTLSDEESNIYLSTGIDGLESVMDFSV